MPTAGGRCIRWPLKVREVHGERHGLMEHGVIVAVRVRAGDDRLRAAAAKLAPMASLAQRARALRILSGHAQPHIAAPRAAVGWVRSPSARHGGFAAPTSASRSVRASNASWRL